MRTRWQRLQRGRGIGTLRLVSSHDQQGFNTHSLQQASSTAVAEFPYKGTFSELRTVTSEINEVMGEMRELELQLEVLHEHKERILQLVRLRAEGGEL